MKKTLQACLFLFAFPLLINGATLPQPEPPPPTCAGCGAKASSSGSITHASSCPYAPKK